jgi:hypothetical protein
MPKQTTITDDVVETWKAMPLMFGYDKDRREFLAIRNYHVNGDDGKPLTENLRVTKDLVDAACARHGKELGTRMVRAEMSKIINDRIDKVYKGKNYPIPIE